MKRKDRSIFSIFTHLTKREELLLFELSHRLLDRPVIVEIGSYLGASTCFLAAGARSRGGKVYAVDTWTNVAMSERPRDTYEDFLRNTEPLKDWIVPLRGFSTEIARQFHEEIDLLFVDGDHSYEAVRADLEAWLSKLKDDGIVIFHDYGWAEGVRRVVRELIVPVQVEGGRRLDSIYWTRISHDKRQDRQPTLLASVIIPTYDRPHYLRDALLSIQAQDFDRERYEIIVVDNGPLAEAAGVVEEVNKNSLHPVRYFREPRIGLHHARHLGAREARAEILAYIDDDVVVSPSWLEALLGPCKDPEVACVGGKVILRSEGQAPKWLSQFDPTFLSLLDLGEERIGLKWPQGVFGCNMSIRKSVLYEVGGFNPDAMGERRLIWLRGDGETGLHKKVYDAGYKVVYEPQAWVYHQIPASRLTPRQFYWRAFIQGISDSYSRAREMRSSRILPARVLWHGAKCMKRAAQKYFSSVGSDKRLSSMADAWYWYGRGMHQFRVALSQKVRSHTLQDCYL